MVDVSDFLNMTAGLPANATPAQIKQAREYATTLQRLTPPGQSGPYQVYGKYNAIADALRGGLGGLIEKRAGQVEQGVLGAGAANMPRYGDYGPAQPPMPATAGPAAAGPAAAGPAAAAPGPQAAVGQPGAQAASLSPFDRDVAARTLIGEAGDQGPEGMAAVAHVIRNRTQAGFAPNAAGVALQHGQFEPWGNPATAQKLAAISPNDPQYQNAGKLVDGVFSGAIPDVTNGATHFYSPREQAALGRQPPSWAKEFQPTAQIGGHAFFQDPRYAGKLGGGAQPAQAAGGLPDQVTPVHSQTFSPTGEQTGGPGMPGAPQGGPVPPTPAMAQSGLMPLPEDAQIRGLVGSSDPELRAHGFALAEQKRQALQPQMMATPTGQQLLYNPYTTGHGGIDTGIPGKPVIEQLPYDVAGAYKGVMPATYGRGPNGEQFLQQMPIVPPGGTPPGGMPGGPIQVPPMQGGPAPAPGGAPRYQPMGAPGGMQGGPGGMQGGPGGMQNAQMRPEPDLNQGMGPGGMPVANSALHGAPAGAAPAGAFSENMSVPEKIAWAQRYKAESAGMSKQSEKVSEALGEAHGDLIKKGNAAPDELRTLMALQDAYSAPHTAGGPAHEQIATMRAFLGQMMGQEAAKEVPADQLIAKTNTQLGYRMAGDLTSRPALLEVMMALKSTAGGQLSDAASRYLINMTIQQKLQDQAVGVLARQEGDSRVALDKRDQFYQQHPLTSPLTGQPLQTRMDYKADLDKWIAANPETRKGFLGTLGNTLSGALAQPAPQGQAAPAGAPQIRNFNPATGRLE